jgi:tRNA (adenine22-N1)-methyltransferase
MAGMGGGTIREILSRSPEVLGRLGRLVCQPMNGAAGLRQWLLSHGWKLVAEDLVIDAGRLYEIIAAEPGEMPQVEPILLEIGPLLWQQKHPLLREQLQRMIKRLMLRSSAMEQSSDPAVREKLQLCRKKLCELEEKMQCL